MTAEPANLTPQAVNELVEKIRNEAARDDDEAAHFAEDELPEDDLELPIVIGATRQPQHHGDPPQRRYVQIINEPVHAADQAQPVTWAARLEFTRNLDDATGFPDATEAHLAIAQILDSFEASGHFKRWKFMPIPHHLAPHTLPEKESAR